MPDAARYHIPDAARYHRLQLALAAAGLALSIAYLVALLLTGAAHALARAAATATDSAWGQVAIVAVVLAGAHALLTFPLAWTRGWWLPRRYGLLHQSLRGWLADRAKAAVLAGALGLAAVEVVYALLRATPPWWLWAAPVFLAATVALAFVFPVWIVPLFYRLTPLADAELRERLLTLARRAGVPAVGVWIADQSRKSRTANAAVIGLGRTRRIVLFDTLAARFTPDEIESVLAHQLGDDGQSRGVHRRDGAARRAQPRGAAAEPIERARALLAPGARPADRARQRRPRMTRRRTLRTLVEAKQGLIVPGAYDGISAKLVQQAGFPAVYMTGYGTSASRLGLPDLGFAGLAEMADHARSLVAVLDIPLIADADTGYGNALNVRRTVQVYEAAGVAALHIEDQITPKRCGHLAGHQVIPRGEFIGKIRAAVEARTDPDLLVIARTDAISAVDFDEALRRGEAAAKAGADVLFIEAPRDEAQVERVARAFDTPLLYNYAPGGRSPLLPFARLRQLGFAIVLLPVDTLLVAVQSIRDFLAALKARDDVLSLKDRYMPFRDFNELIGVNAQLALAERYKDDARSAT